MEEPVIREGRAEDLAGVAAVQAESPEAPAWRVEEYLAYQLDVAERGGEIVGFLVTRRLVEGEAEVLNVAVALRARRQGVARRLLRLAMGRWPGEWYLEVRESNAGARACYQQLGFREAGRRPGYYASGNENSAEVGMVMEWHQ